MNGRVVYDAVAAVGHRARDAGGQERLAEARCADKQKRRRGAGEVLRIAERVAVGAFHQRPGACLQPLVILCRIQIEPESVKAFGAEQRGKFLFLLLPAKFLEAFAHLRAHIACAAAFGAERLDSQIVRLQPLGLQNPVALLLERQIVLFQLLHGSHGVALTAERRGKHMCGGPAQLPFDLAQTRLFFIDRRNAGAGGLLVLLVFALQALHCALHNGLRVCHGQSSLSFSRRSTAARSSALNSSWWRCTP